MTPGALSSWAVDGLALGERLAWGEGLAWGERGAKVMVVVLPSLG